MRGVKGALGVSNAEASVVGAGERTGSGDSFAAAIPADAIQASDTPIRIGRLVFMMWQLIRRRHPDLSEIRIGDMPANRLLPLTIHDPVPTLGCLSAAASDQNGWNAFIRFPIGPAVLVFHRRCHVVGFARVKDGGVDGPGVGGKRIPAFLPAWDRACDDGLDRG
jgi:hypothetical protein